LEPLASAVDGVAGSGDEGDAGSAFATLPTFVSVAVDSPVVSFSTVESSGGAVTLTAVVDGATDDLANQMDDRRIVIRGSGQIEGRFLWGRPLFGFFVQNPIDRFFNAAGGMIMQLQRIEDFPFRGRHHFDRQGGYLLQGINGHDVQRVRECDRQRVILAGERQRPKALETFSIWPQPERWIRRHLVAPSKTSLFKEGICQPARSGEWNWQKG